MVNIGIGVVRTKVMALLLGPAGVGLLGLYSSIADLAQNLAGMGINSSGVRQIAEAAGSGESKRVAQTATVLRRTAVFLGLLGAALLLVLARQAARLTFGDDQHAGAVALLALAVGFGAISGGQGALIQGMRRIADLAKMSVLGAVFGTLISITLVGLLRERGLVPSLVGIAAMSVLTSWWYSRKVQVESVAMTTAQVWREAAALLKLGLAFMASGFLVTGAAYAIRLIVLRRIGFDAAGLYQSAWNLGGVYVGFILQAMGTDFYPRLTAVAKDNSECNRTVNEQALVSLLLAGPGVIATLTLAPVVIDLFYTPRFAAAVGVLRWLCLGLSLRVIAWPMGFIVLAKNAQTLFFLTEVAATVVHVGLAWFLVGAFGLPGAGMAFFGLYIWHGTLMYVVVRWLTGFRWSPANRQTALFLLALIAVVFCGFRLLKPWMATAVGLAVTAVSTVYSTRMLATLVSLDALPQPIQRLLARFRIASPRPRL